MPDSTQAPALSAQLLAAAQAVSAVLSGQSLSEALEHAPSSLRPGAQALSFHAMRHLGLARAAAAVLIPRQPAEPLVRALILLGLCLLDASLQHAQAEPLAHGTPVYPSHTLVHQLVEAAHAHRRSRSAKGLINAVLRRYGREYATLRPRLVEQPEARWNHPTWWIATLQRAWPDDWMRILQAAQQPPPMMLRVNTRALTREDLAQRLQLAGISCHAVGDDGLRLDSPQPVRTIPGYEQGWWSVQDASAQCAAPLLPLADGQRVLDACAAPGGKTAHLLERHSLYLTALDSDTSRLARVYDTLQRLGLQSPDVTLKCADAADVPAWWDGQPYDAILADVPCTASGIVRRHPDIRWLRRPDDLSRTAALQTRIIDALWPTLIPGGHLLYATCSIFPQEGEDQARAFLERHPDARHLSAPGHILPGNPSDGDGFFYALFAKTS
ncbi:MAG TPA: 16S rRNA (cytosine(967)-C(5))-methyltransferase RsmB [Castellaniella sp.]|uniref:16S rRNA (cytosine(967)-C(5))-methyltransferase RsmB n=1 Tax=Castellaniella sp. TaxID=1955812 RepID=UPI002EEC4027